MPYWDHIEELRFRYLEDREDSRKRKEWEVAVEEEIAKLDMRIRDWDHANVHEIRHISKEAHRLSIYAKAHGLPFVSAFVYNEPLPSKPIPEKLRGVVLAIDKQDNWLMNDDQESIKYAPDHL